MESLEQWNSQDHKNVYAPQGKEERERIILNQDNIPTIIEGDLKTVRTKKERKHCSSRVKGDAGSLSWEERKDDQSS